MSQFSEKQNVVFRIIDGIAKIVYMLRENYLLRLNNWLDRKAGDHWTE